MREAELELPVTSVCFFVCFFLWTFISLRYALACDARTQGAEVTLMSLPLPVFFFFRPPSHAQNRLLKRVFRSHSLIISLSLSCVFVCVCCYLFPTCDLLIGFYVVFRVGRPDGTNIYHYEARITACAHVCCEACLALPILYMRIGLLEEQEKQRSLYVNPTFFLFIYLCVQAPSTTSFFFPYSLFCAFFFLSIYLVFFLLLLIHIFSSSCFFFAWHFFFVVVRITQRPRDYCVCVCVCV